MSAGSSVPVTLVRTRVSLRPPGQYLAGGEARVRSGFEPNGLPGYRDYAPGYYSAYLLDPDANNVEALYRDVGNPGCAG